MEVSLSQIKDGDFELFVPFSKINEGTGEFEAWATIEEIDQSGEIIDLDKSWPYFEALAERFSKVTSGANFGPLREQHDPNKASGHLIAPPVIKTHESGARGIYINGLLTDEGSKKKLNAKTLTGVSIGGNYVGEVEKVKIGERDAKKFVANPNHYGVVDSPCVKNALVTVVKADGSQTVEKLTGFNPTQGFECRKGAFHVKKEDAKKCESDHSDVIEKVEEKGIIEGAPAADEFKKSLYAIARISSILGDLMAARSDAEFEAAWDIIDGEVPNSEVINDLTAAAQSIFDALEAIIADQRAELAETDTATSLAEAVTDYAPVFEMSTLIGALKKSSTAKQLIKSLHVHTGNESSSTVIKEDTMDKKAEEKPVEKTEQKPAEKSAESGELSKAATDQIAKAVGDGLAKALEPISAKVDAIEKSNVDTKSDIDRISKAIKGILDRAAPPKAVKRVTKAEDGKEESADHGKSEKTVEKTSLELMSASLEKPQAVQFGRLVPNE